MKFEILPNELKELQNWESNHKCKAKPTAIGGRFTYMFIPTSLGVLSYCKCVCGKQYTINNGSNF